MFHLDSMRFQLLYFQKRRQLSEVFPSMGNFKAGGMKMTHSYKNISVFKIEINNFFYRTLSFASSKIFQVCQLGKQS